MPQNIYAAHAASSQPSASIQYFIILFVFITVALILYFAPYIIARVRKNRNIRAIFILNLLGGWTFFGWRIALAWAYANDPASPEHASAAVTPPRDMSLALFPEGDSPHRHIDRKHRRAAEPVYTYEIDGEGEYDFEIVGESFYQDAIATGANLTLDARA